MLIQPVSAVGLSAPLVIQEMAARYARLKMLETRDLSILLRN